MAVAHIVDCKSVANMRLLILLALVGAIFAVPKKVSKIVGGEATDIRHYPFMSNMMFNSPSIGWSQWCGGSLITTDGVLSAVHCYVNTTASQWNVRLGSSFASSGGQVIPVLEMVLHEGYVDNGVFTNDVAIIRLASDANLNANVQLAVVATPHMTLHDGTAVTAIGWGALESGGESPEHLQRVKLNIINHKLCAERYAANVTTQSGFEQRINVTNDMLCAGILDVGGKDTCQGDSGGPLIHDKDVVVGITSWGYGCADAFYPGVYTKVSSFTEWIILNALSSKKPYLRLS